MEQGYYIAIANRYQQRCNSCQKERIPATVLLRQIGCLVSSEQLIAEVKSIYAGLVMVEAKCIDVDNKQAAQPTKDSTMSSGKL